MQLVILICTVIMKSVKNLPRNFARSRTVLADGNLFYVYTKVPGRKSQSIWQRTMTVFTLENIVIYYSELLLLEAQQFCEKNVFAHEAKLLNFHLLHLNSNMSFESIRQKIKVS